MMPFLSEPGERAASWVWPWDGRLTSTIVR
jgi:hypothetical protein